MENDQTPPSQHSRRTFIKRAAATGTAVWAAPAILSLSSSAAQASHGPVHACTVCNASSYGVSVTGTVAGIGPVALGPVPTAPPDAAVASVSVPGVISTGVLQVTAGEAAGSCTATASVDSTSILSGLVTVGVLQSIASVACDCSSEVLDSNIVGLTVGGNAVGLSGAPNQTLATIVVNLGALTTANVDITANRQSCVGGTRSVDALVVRVRVFTGVAPALVTDLTVVLAHSQVNNGCPC